MATHCSLSLLLFCVGVLLHTAEGQSDTFLLEFPADLGCKMSLASFGADPTGRADVSPVLASVSSIANWDVPGIAFLRDGSYSVKKSVSVPKAVHVSPGAVFNVAPGVTLEFNDLFVAPPRRAFTGGGNVIFRGSISTLLPEWFGAVGDGATDDAAAINWAFQSANNSGVEVVFSDKTYAIGSKLLKGRGTRIFSYPGATLRALKPGLTGMIFESNGHMRPDQLPAFVGFSTAIIFSDVGMTDCYTPLITNAPGMPCNVGMEMNADSTKIRFGTIRNCKTGIWVTTPDAGRYVMQGFAVEGEAYIDNTGVGKQVILFTARNKDRPPYWDHDFFSIRKITPHPAARGFAVVRSDPLLMAWGLPFHTYEFGELAALPPDGKLLDTNMWDSVVRVRPTTPFKDGQLDYPGGDFNSIYIDGPLGKQGKTLRLATATNSLRAFKAANSLSTTPFANLLNVQLPVTKRWPAGEMRYFYLYHQLAYDGQCLFMNVPGVGSQCTSNGMVAVVALTDNSLKNDIVKTGVKYEIVLSVLACKDLAAGVKPSFPVSVGAVAS